MRRLSAKDEETFRLMCYNALAYELSFIDSMKAATDEESVRTMAESRELIARFKALKKKITGGE